MKNVQPHSRLESLCFYHRSKSMNQFLVIPLLDMFSGYGIDTYTFKAHLVKGTACSAAAWSDVATTDILNAADQLGESIFLQFYHQEIMDRLTFRLTVLPSAC